MALPDEQHYLGLMLRTLMSTGCKIIPVQTKNMVGCVSTQHCIRWLQGKFPHNRTQTSKRRFICRCESLFLLESTVQRRPSRVDFLSRNAQSGQSAHSLFPTNSLLCLFLMSHYERWAVWPTLSLAWGLCIRYHTYLCCVPPPLLPPNRLWGQQERPTWSSLCW